MASLRLTQSGVNGQLNVHSIHGARTVGIAIEAVGISSERLSTAKHGIDDKLHVDCVDFPVAVHIAGYCGWGRLVTRHLRTSQTVRLVRHLCPLFGAGGPVKNLAGEDWRAGLDRV